MTDFPGSSYTAANISQGPQVLVGGSITSTNTSQGVLGLPPVINYYKMVGYYVASAAYEAFVVTGSPSAASTTNPNTGHALVNTFVASFWKK